MLTPPKWQTLWLKSKYSSRSVSNKIMFFKPAEKILDDISNCCSSTSKELTLEALSCWRIWIENQLVEDWKQNKICYSAVKPLLTVKFHPLHKDDEIIETKLGLMWFTLHKIQHLIQLEGPQHILEVFIQSCLSWLSCTEDLLPETSTLILKLINSLFTKDVSNFDKKGSFPPLEVSVLQSSKLFARLLPSFLEIFHNWTKIKEKTDLLCIWKNFLGHCERSFKFIPVSSWHKIFKLVENICADEKETIENKLSVLHKCATSLKSVMYNSKFIDCSQLLTTPAEALLKLVIELSINNAEDKKSFEMFRYCHEICHVLSNQIIHTLGYESCIYILPKLEEITSKSLHWGLWSGLANCFKDEMENVHFDQYNQLELKIFKKLRSVAVNFDLDRFYLEENSILMVQNQLGFLRIGINCRDCPICTGKTTDSIRTEENEFFHEEPDSEMEILEEEEIFPYSGYFGFDLNTKYLADRDNKRLHYLPAFSNFQNLESQGLGNEEIRRTSSNFDEIPLAKNLADRRWLRCNFNFKSFVMCNLLFFNTELNERLTIYTGHDSRRSFVVAPTYITLALQEIIRKTRKNSDSSSKNLIENVKKFQNKLNQCRFFTPIKLSVSLEGSEGVKFCKDFLRFWEDVEDIVYDVDFGKNLNNLMTKNDNSLVCFCMFAFLVNFTFNLFVENTQNGSCRCKRFCVGEGTVLSRKITNFTKKVLQYKRRLSNSDFIDNLSKILPRNDENPLVLWSKNNSAMEANKMNSKHKKPALQSVLNEDSCASVSGNNLVIFKCFDELQNKFSNEKIFSSPLVVDTTGRRKRKYCLNESGKYSQNSTNPVTVDVTPRAVFSCGKIWENQNVKVILAPPDVFRSLNYPELRPEIDPKECNTIGRDLEVTNYLLDKIQCDGRGYSSEDESPARKRKFCVDLKPELKNVGEVTDDIGSIVKCKTNRVSTPSNKTKENLPLPCSEPYFLRRRPLKLPLKFKGEKTLFGRKQSGNTPRKVTTPKSLNKVGGNENTTEEVLTKSVDAAKILDSNNSDVVSPALKTEERVEEANAHGDVLTKSVDAAKILDSMNSDVVSPALKTEERVEEANAHGDVLIIKEERDTKIIGPDLVDVDRPVAETRDKCEPELQKVQNTPSYKVEQYADGECEIGAISSPVTTKKRLASSTDEGVCRKKLKLEPGAREESNEEDTVIKTIEPKSDVRSDREPIDHADGSKRTHSEAESVSKTSVVSVVQSRGSKMLALISESQKIEQFYETSPSSKHQASKPHVNKNSRASKMLALLPEFHELGSNSEVDHVEESGERVKEESVKKETSGHIVGKSHHLARNINNIINGGSPKGSPKRQRKSIRFDDDKNETVTYYRDSPPCLLRADFAKGNNK